MNRIAIGTRIAGACLAASTTFVVSPALERGAPTAAEVIDHLAPRGALVLEGKARGLSFKVVEPEALAHHSVDGLESVTPEPTQPDVREPVDE